MDNTPHTPTPFKNALEKYGPLKPLVRGYVGGRCRSEWWAQPACGSQAFHPEISGVFS